MPYFGQPAFRHCHFIFLGGGAGGAGSPAVTLRAAHRALAGIVARTANAIEPSRKCLAFLIRHLPAPKYTVAHLICRWLQRNAHWDKYRYASFHANHSGEHTVWCADWSEDWLVSQQMTQPPPTGGGRGRQLIWNHGGIQRRILCLILYVCLSVISMFATNDNA